MSFNPGEQVGPYRIMEQLGQGGIATVFKAYHPALDRYPDIASMTIRTSLFWILSLLSLLLSACQTAGPSQAMTQVMAKTSVAYTQAMATELADYEQTAAASTPTPTQLTSALTATPNPLVTSSSFSGWKVYINDYMGYQFSYPPDAKVTEEGFNGMELSELVPAGITFNEYFDYLSRTLPKKICVGVHVSDMATVLISPPYEPIGKYSAPCGGLGGGSHRTEDVSDTFDVGGESYTQRGAKFICEDTGAFDREFYIISLENGFNLYFYGGSGEKTSQTYEEYLPYKKIVKQILSTLHWTAPPPVAVPTFTCAGIFTRLIPGSYAKVSEGVTDPTPVRSEPRTGNNIIATISPGTVIKVVEGPLCADGLIFWKVAGDVIPNGSGWIAEGNGTVYYFAPSTP